MWNKITEGKRGRPPSPWHSYHDKGLITYITRLSEKHGFNPDRFLKKIVEARENKKSAYKTLTIQRRMQTKDYAIFRITRKGSLVAQLRIPNYLLVAEDKLKIKPNTLT